MAVQTIGLIGMGCLITLIFLRVPVGVAMGLVGLCGYAAVDGWDKAFRVFGQVPFDVATNYNLSVVPMFILMGEVATRSGISAQLYRAAKAVFAGVRGTQALATIGACAGFGAVCGSSLATAATMTRIAIPEMRRAGYDDRISTGSVAAGGSIGILVPPSIVLVLYAIISQQSVPRLFAAGMIPGMVLAALYMICALVTLRVKPAMGAHRTRWHAETAGKGPGLGLGSRGAVRAVDRRTLRGLVQPDRSRGGRRVPGACPRLRAARAELARPWSPASPTRSERPACCS